MASTSGRPWRRALAWLAFLGPFFFLSYGLANWYASTQSNVGAIVFDWERQIPFIAWTIIPYWSIDLLYGLSIMLCVTRDELDAHAQRLLGAQLIAVACFVAFPLRFTFDRPVADGVPGLMFQALGGFDLPFNQAPSLHIALLLIIWGRLAAYTPAVLHWPLHGWMLLIGVSVLTTFQHHFIDIPTGMLAGFLCVWLWPVDAPSPLAHAAITTDPVRRALALRYGCGALACAAVAVIAGGSWLWMWWPAVSLLLVALCYLVLGEHGFQKSSRGELSIAARWLFAPYLLGALANARIWTRREAVANHVIDDVWLGRAPSGGELARSSFRAVVDLTSEMSLGARAERVGYASVPVLDLTTPSAEQMRAAAGAIERLRAEGPVLVCCALGYSRSACAIATWLLATGRARSTEHAIQIVERARPRVVLGAGHRDVLKAVAP